MKNSHILDLIPAYALGILDGDEAQAVTEHLENCTSCQAELANYEAVLAMLALTAPDAVPSPMLHDKLMTSLPSQSTTPSALAAPTSSESVWWQSFLDWFRKPAPAWRLVGVLGALLIVMLGIWLWQPTQETSLNAMQTIALVGTNATSEAQGMLVIGSDGKDGALVVENLPPLNAEHQYQLWLIEDEKRTSGAIFSVDAEGYAAVMVSSSRPLTEYGAFGITIEPVGGSPKPTGQKVLGNAL